MVRGVGFQAKYIGGNSRIFKAYPYPIMRMVKVLFYHPNMFNFCEVPALIELISKLFKLLLGFLYGVL